MPLGGDLVSVCTDVCVFTVEKGKLGKSKNGLKKTLGNCYDGPKNDEGLNLVSGNGR